MVVGGLGGVVGGGGGGCWRRVWAGGRAGGIYGGRAGLESVGRGCVVPRWQLFVSQQSLADTPLLTVPRIQQPNSGTLGSILEQDVGTPFSTAQYEQELHSQLLRGDVLS